MPEDRLRVQVLGPVRAWRGTGELAIGSRKQRAVLGLLAVHAGRPVQQHDLVDFVWPDTPPATAVNALHTYVRGIRQALEPAAPPRHRDRLLRSTSGGYLLDAEVDLHRFRGLVAEAGGSRDAGE